MLVLPHPKERDRSHDRHPTELLGPRGLSRAEAADATLDHVRQRHLAAADAWDELAQILQVPVQRDIDAPFMRIEAFVRTEGSQFAGAGQ
jgi:hypothetical protein